MPTLLGLCGDSCTANRRGDGLLRCPDGKIAGAGQRRPDRLLRPVRAVDPGKRRPGVPGHQDPPIHVRSRPRRSVAAVRQRADPTSSTTSATIPGTRPSERNWMPFCRRGSRRRTMISSPARSTSGNGATRSMTRARFVTRIDEWAHGGLFDRAIPQMDRPGGEFLAAGPCVATMTVPPSRWKSRRCAETHRAFSGSRLPVGSSARINFG